MITRWQTISAMLTRERHVPVLSAVLILCFSVALRGYALSRSSYWNDEMISLGYALTPAWGAVFWDNSPPLYHMLLKLWVSLFGSSENATRSLSVIFSVGATAMVMKIGHDLRGHVGLICAGALHALSVLSINYAQETRMYGLYEFCVAINLFFFLPLYLDSGKRSVKGYVASVVLVASSSYLAVVPLVVQELLFIVRDVVGPKRERVALAIHSGLLICIAAIGVCCLYWVSWSHLGWQKAKFEFEASSHYPVALIGKLTVFSWVFAAVFLCVAISGAFTKKGRREQLALATLVLASIALMTAAGFVFSRGMLLERYLINVVPPFALWVCLALLDAPWSGRVKSVAAALMFAALLAALPRAYLPYKEDWREAAEIVHRRPGLVLTMSKPAVRNPYFSRHGIQLEQWDPRDEDGEELLRSEVLRLGRVWIVDSRTNAHFHSAIRRWTSELGLSVEDFSVATGSSTSLELMMIEDPIP